MTVLRTHSKVHRTVDVCVRFLAQLAKSPVSLQALADAGVSQALAAWPVRAGPVRCVPPLAGCHLPGFRACGWAWCTRPRGGEGPSVCPLLLRTSPCLQMSTHSPASASGKRTTSIRSLALTVSRSLAALELERGGWGDGPAAAVVNDTPAA